MGSFWDRSFHDSVFVNFIKDIHYKLSRRMDALSDSIAIGSSCLSSGKYYQYDTIRVPVDACTMSTKSISNYTMSGSVYQHSPVRTLQIPKSIIGEPYVVISGHTWVRNINMDIKDQFVTLYVPYNVDLVTDVMLDGSELVNSYVIKKGTTIPYKTYSNYSTLLGIDLDRIHSSVRKVIWRSSVLGLREADVNFLLSYLVGNEVAMSDSTVSEVWEECGHYMISTVDGNVYSGHGVPIVSVGDPVVVGDLLFYGVHKFDRHKLPHPEYIPELTIRTSCGDIIARNDIIPPIKTPYDYIPDMCNKEWEDKLYGTSNRKSMLDSDRSINPLHYAIQKLIPASGCIYRIDELQCNDNYTIKVIIDHIYNGVLSSGLILVYGRSKPDPLNIDIIGAEPIVSVSSQAGNTPVTIGAMPPIVHIV